MKQVNSFLFSTGTRFAQKINEYYYGNKHYVWCTTYYDNEKQAITSNPRSICKRLIDLICTSDRHAEEFNKLKAGILRGAQAKLEQGIINEEQFKEIGQLVNLAKYKDFFPVIYVIDLEKVGKERCLKVSLENCASDKSIEYQIVDLEEGEFQLIDVKEFFRNIFTLPNIKVGE